MMIMIGIVHMLSYYEQTVFFFWLTICLAQLVRDYLKSQFFNSIPWGCKFLKFLFVFSTYIGYKVRWYLKVHFVNNDKTVNPLNFVLFYNFFNFENDSWIRDCFLSLYCRPVDYVCLFREHYVIQTQLVYNEKSCMLSQSSSSSSSSLLLFWLLLKETILVKYN